MVQMHREPSVDDIVAHRVAKLTDYKDANLAKRYSDMVQRVRSAGLNYAAVKAVARLLTSYWLSEGRWKSPDFYTKPDRFRKALTDTFQGDMKLTFHFGAWPSWWARQRDRYTKGEVSGSRAMFFFGMMNGPASCAAPSGSFPLFRREEALMATVC